MLVKSSGCEIGRQHGNIVQQLERAVSEGLLFDISPVSQAVFEPGILCVVSSGLNEILTWADVDRQDCNTPHEEMMLDIKKAMRSQWFIEHVGDLADIHEFLALGMGASVAVEILQLPEFLVYVYPIGSISTLLILHKNESPEDFGLVL